jgi:multidrug resistance efflux pump
MKKKHLKLVLTCVVVGSAIGLVMMKYADYLRNPWTRDGQVRANVIAVAPRISGPIVALPIVDNQRVKTGDLLFRIDPRTFQAQYDQAKANFDATVDQLASLDQQVLAGRASVAQADAQVNQAQAQVREAEANAIQAVREYERYDELLQKGFTSRANFEDQLRNRQVTSATLERTRGALAQAQGGFQEAQAQLATAIAKRGATGDDNAQLRATKAALDSAQLNLDFTEQRASVDGYVTNLNLRLGSQAVANQPSLALIDEKSYWVDAYFRETAIGGIRPGDQTFVTLMAYPDIVVPAQVDSLGWGIAKQDGSTGSNLLPVIQPSFEWIRLAQRVPVRIKLGELPSGVELRVGTTASVLVRSGTSETVPPPAPRLLQ